MNNERQPRSFSFESLEPKEMLTGTVHFDAVTESLTITGSGNDDWYDIRQAENNKLVVFEDTNRGQFYNASQTPDSPIVFEIDQQKVAEIVFRGLGGDDYFANQTDKPSRAFGGGGDDILHGGDGADFIHGGSGNDYVRANFGNDRLAGGSGNDWISAGHGNDKIFGGSGNDVAFGGDGNDRIAMHSGDDRAYGGAGKDNILLGAGNDFAEGADGNDRIVGHRGNDELDGGDGNDIIIGAAGRDFMRGGDGNDRLVGGSDDDRILGDDGVDRILGNGGDDYLDAGLGGIGGGNWYTKNADHVFGGAGDDEIVAFGGWNRLFGGDGNDKITGGAFAYNDLFGESGNDILKGGTKWDVLKGGSGNDQLDGSHGNDELVPGPGIDNVDGGVGFDSVKFTSTKSSMRMTGVGTIKATGLADGVNYLTAVESGNFAGSVAPITVDSGCEETDCYDPTDEPTGSDLETLTINPGDVSDSYSGYTQDGFMAFNLDINESGFYSVQLSKKLGSNWGDTNKLTIKLQKDGQTVDSKYINPHWTNDSKTVFQNLTKDDRYYLVLNTDGLTDVGFKIKLLRQF